MVDRVAPSSPRRAAHAVAKRLFPLDAPRGSSLRRVVLRHTVRSLARALESTPMAGKLWLMGGLAIGYARNGSALANDLNDVDLGYADVDHDKMMATIALLANEGFHPQFRLKDNAGDVTIVRLRRDGVWFDLVRCFERGEREYWITYSQNPDAPGGELEVETEVALQQKVPTRPELYGTTWLVAADLDRYLTEQYGEWAAPDELFYGREWLHVRDSPAVVRCEPWLGRWDRWSDPA